MVFFLDRTICVEISSRPDSAMTQNEILFFTELAIACQRGKCVLCGDIYSLDWLSSYFGNSLVGSIYKTIASHYSEQRAIFESVLTVFVLTYSAVISDAVLPEALQDSKKVKTIPIRTAEKWSCSDKCCLLTENLDDCKFYELVAQHYNINNKIKGLNISFHHECGGGDTTCEVLKKCVTLDVKPTLCIVDSDWKYGKSEAYPNTPRCGGTAVRARRIAQGLKGNDENPPCEFFQLPVHEVENLIPFQIFEQLPDDLPDAKTGLELLSNLRTVYNGEPLLYYDLKKGFSKMEHEPQKAYWQEIFQELGEELPANLPSLTSNNLLGRAITYISDSINTLEIDEYLASIWNNLGAVLLTWGCVSPTMLA